MEKNHWSSWTSKTLTEPNSDMNNWTYSDERMRLRQKVFRALTPYLDQSPRHVYEFCNFWTKEEDPSTKLDANPIDIELAFQDYIKNKIENSYAKSN